MTTWTIASKNAVTNVSGGKSIAQVAYRTGQNVKLKLRTKGKHHTIQTAMASIIAAVLQTGKFIKDTSIFRNRV